MDKQFPSGFYWGASTSSHQVEGGLENDWSEWEQSEKRLQHLKKSGLLAKHGLDNFMSARATDHSHLFKEDFQAAKDMGHNATRFSLEWSSIEPKEGEWNLEAIEKYKVMITHLRSLGIEPFVTLYHWTMPRWFRDLGAWKKKSNVKYFVRYVEKITKELGSDVVFWVTLNEPEIYASQSYLAGVWPPQEKNPLSYLLVIKNLIYAHREAYVVIKKNNPMAQIGIAKNNIHFEAHKNYWFNRIIKSVVHWWWNCYFLNQIKDCQDYIGLNYYFRNKLHLWMVKNENKVVSDLGWELHPEGILHVLKDLGRYKKPIYITENGLADANDKQRKWFITEILKFVHQAIEHGIEVRGYLHWSLIDNFEWAHGFTPRFGLLEVDYKTMKRTPRPAAQLYKEIIENNGITSEVLKKHGL